MSLATAVVEAIVSFWCNLDTLRLQTVLEGGKLLRDNRLFGQIPEELGTLLKLQDLQLARNRISGTVPSSFASLRKDVSVDVSGNILMGPVPVGLAVMGICDEAEYLDGHKCLACHTLSWTWAGTIMKEQCRCPLLK